MPRIHFVRSQSTAGRFWKHEEVSPHRHIHAVTTWEILTTHFSPFQGRAWVPMFCTCVTQPRCTHSALFTAQVTKRWVIGKRRFPFGELHWKGSVWAMVPVHTSTFGRVQVQTVLQHWFLLCWCMTLPMDLWWSFPLFCKSPRTSAV